MLPQATEVSEDTGVSSLEKLCIQALLDVPHWTIPRTFIDSLPPDVANAFLARLLEAYPSLPSFVLDKFGESACALHVPDRQSSNLQLQYIASALQFRRLEALKAAKQKQEAARLLSKYGHSLAGSLRVLELPGLWVKQSRAAATAGFLGALTSLEHLDLRDSALPAAWAKDLTENLHGLTHLNLARTIFHGRPELEALGSLGNLRHLNLDRTDSKSLVPGPQRILEEEGLTSLLALSQLTFLNISHSVASSLPAIQTLQSLHMRRCCLAIAGVAPKLPSLTELDLQSSRLSGSESEALLAEVLGAAKPRLRRLCLGELVVDPSGREAQPAEPRHLSYMVLATVLMEAPRLQHLDLSGSLVASDEFQPLLSSLATLKTLQTLILAGSNLAFLDGPSHHFQLPANLERLDLSSFRGEPEERVVPGFLARVVGRHSRTWRSRLQHLPGRASWHREATLLSALQMPHLTELIMCRSGLSGWNKLATAGGGLSARQTWRLSSLSNVRRLDLSRNNIPLEMLEGIVGGLGCLTELSIFDEPGRLLRPPEGPSNFNLEPMEQETAYVATIARLANLERLCLGFVQYISSLKPLIGLQKLEDLVVFSSPQDAGKVALFLEAAVKSGWPSLKRWHLGQPGADFETQIARPGAKSPSKFCLSPREAPEYLDQDAVLRFSCRELLNLRPLERHTCKSSLHASLPPELLESIHGS